MYIDDMDFFEAYKRLAKLCSEMYACNNGVSEYISEMERLSSQGKHRVPSWNNDYMMLKHVRWVRNQIAHESDSYQISEPEDLEFVQDFRSRIFSGNDPLTLLRKAIESKDSLRKPQKPQVQQSPYQSPAEPRNDSPGNTNSQPWVAALVGIGTIALILLLFLRSVL